MSEARSRGHRRNNPTSKEAVGARAQRPRGAIPLKVRRVVVRRYGKMRASEEQTHKP